MAIELNNERLTMTSVATISELAFPRAIDVTPDHKITAPTHAQLAAILNQR